MANPCGFSCILLVFTAGIVVLMLTLMTPTSAQLAPRSDRIQTITHRYRVYRYYCTRYYYTYCYRWYYYRYWYWRWYYGPYWWYGYYYRPYYGWGYWRYCYRRYRYSCCYYRYYWRSITRYVCKTGWTGSSCTIPVCSSTCANGQVCKYDSSSRSNRCVCQAQGTSAACSILPCSRQNNCYPGTCVGRECKCPDGFNGSNCLTIDQKPSIGECVVNLYARPTPSSTPRVVGTANCEDDDLEPLTAWVGDGLDFSRPDRGLTKIEVNWKAEYDNRISMPSRTTSPFVISNAPVQLGITGGSFIISIDDQYTSDPYYCQGLSASDPVTATTDQCALLRTWSSLGINSQLMHNNTMTITMSNKLGGQKIGDGNYRLNGVLYGGIEHTFTSGDARKRARFLFDLKRPSHCLLENGVADVKDHKTNCSVFPISLEQDITPNRTVTPRFLGWTDDSSGVDRFEVEVYRLRTGSLGTLVQLGTPDIAKTTVTPDLNNFQFVAREIGVYAIVLTVYDGANNSARARKIFNYNDQPGFTDTNAPISFRGVSEHNRSYITKKLDDNNKLTLNWTGRFIPKNHELGRRVEPWPADQNSIDDIYGSVFGLRSTSAVSSAVGVSSMTCVYLIDPKDGGRGFAKPELDGKSRPEGVVVGNCSTDLETDSGSLDLDVPLRSGDTVVVWLTAADQSGQKVTVKFYSTVDLTRPNVSAHEFSKNRDSKYESYVEVTAIDRESGINSTRYRIIDTRNNNIPLVEGVAPAKTRHAPDSTRRKRNAGPVKSCTTDDPTCYCIPQGECFPYKQEIMIDHCDIDQYKGDGHQLEFRYTVFNRAGQKAPENRVLLTDLQDVECRPPPGLSVGLIVGIVIIIIIGLLLLILLIMVVIRVYRKQPPVPERFRTMAHQARRRFTMREDKAEDNQVYAVHDHPPAYPGQPRGYHENIGLDDDMYVDKSDLVAAKFPRKQLEMADTLAEGRFAIIRRAHMDNSNGRSVVAAKALRNGFSKPDEVLMTKKIQCLRDIPAHGNIVRFIGEVDENSPEGPIMVLELCDESLKDWLSKRSSMTMTTDDLEAMLGFSLNIARGVEHLHANKIIHRRLGVRNVMLQQQANGLVAKLIGFGPSAEDEDSSSAKAGTGHTSVPLKWLAPETLDTINSKKPTYNEKTDAWSYGITLWEMYSKGAPPYNGVRSTDIKAHIKQGNRMSCPPDCPPVLFDRVVGPCWSDKANKRPSFTAICHSIEDFRHGADSQTGYYAPNSDDTERELYCDGK